MAAPEIPNLKALLSSRGGGRGRGRGRGGFSGRHGPSEQEKDKIVQQTDNDANDSRMSAVTLGYLDDPFAQAFVHGEMPRRYPIINRGQQQSSGKASAVLKSYRNIRPHNSNRSAGRPLPPYRCPAAKANNIVRGRLRHSLLPPRLPRTRPSSNLPRARLPYKHDLQSQDHQIHTFDPQIHNLDPPLRRRPPHLRRRRQHILFDIQPSPH
jgi:hypothetical protein